MFEQRVLADVHEDELWPLQLKKVSVDIYDQHLQTPTLVEGRIVINVQ